MLLNGQDWPRNSDCPFKRTVLYNYIYFYKFIQLSSVLIIFALCTAVCSIFFWCNISIKVQRKICTIIGLWFCMACNNTSYYIYAYLILLVFQVFIFKNWILGIWKIENNLSFLFWGFWLTFYFFASKFFKNHKFFNTQMSQGVYWKNGDDVCCTFCVDTTCNYVAKFLKQITKKEFFVNIFCRELC